MNSSVLYPSWYPPTARKSSCYKQVSNSEGEFRKLLIVEVGSFRHKVLKVLGIPSKFIGVKTPDILQKKK